MNYEKKYKEALEVAQKLYQDCPNGKNDRLYHTTDLEKMFPELKESEDERIKKEIISFIQDDIDEINLKVSGDYDDRDEDDIAHQNWCKKAISWLENISYTIDREKREGFHLGYKAALEKQGEKSLTVDIESMIEAYEQRLINQGNGVKNSPIVNMCVAAFKHGVENTLDELYLKQGEVVDINPSEFDLRLNQLLMQFESLPKEELASSLSFYLNVVQNNGTYNEEKQAEQKPTIEMKSAEESLGIDSETYNKIVDECIYSEQKSQRMVSAEANEAMYDKPACAWSEEDESWFKELELMVLSFSNDVSYLKKFFDWLKSLKDRIQPKTTWKPSEEQMDALNSARWNAPFNIEILDSLYNDLKKLTE